MRKHSNSFITVLLWIAAAIASWLLFVASSYSFHELWLCAAFTGLTVVMVFLAWRQINVGFAPTLRQLIALWRLPWYVLHDSIEVTAVLMKDALHIRPAGSHFRAAPFASDSGPSDESGVVLATAGTTMTPSIIVLGITGSRFFFHQLERSPVPRMVADIEARQ